MSAIKQPRPATPLPLGGIEEQYRLLLEALPDTALVMLDAGGRVAGWNTGAERFFGWSAGEIVGRPFAMLFPPEDAAAGLPGAQLRGALEGRSAGEHWCIRKDGTKRCCSGSLKVLREANGALRGFAQVLRDQTPGKQHKEEPRRVNDRFELAAEAVDGFIYDADLITGEVFRSDRLYDLLGYHPAEAEPTIAWWVERIHPEDHPRILPQGEVAEPASGQVQHDFEYRVRHRDGHWVDVWDRGVILRDEAGRPVRLVGCTLDISKRRRIEADLRESEERHRVISELTCDYNYALRPDSGGGYLLELVTEGFEKVTGYTKEEVNAQGGWPMLIHPDDMDRVQESHDRSMTGTAPPLELRIRTKDGQVRWLRALSKPQWSEGRVVRTLGAATDITERKVAKEALRESEDRFQLFMDNSSVAAWIKDEQLRYVYVNRASARFMGKEPRECIDLTDREIWPYIADRLQITDRQVLETGRALSFEDVVPDAGGSPQHWLTYKFPFTGTSGRRLVGGMAIDITDRRRAEEEARESRERLQILSRQLITAQESERRRIARELHDEIGQTLTAIALSLQAAGQGANEVGRQRLDEANAIVDQAIEQIRHLSLDLRPSILDDLGLDAALRWYANRQIQRTGLAIRLSTRLEDARLPAEVETTCFRVTQEALTNVVRHAQARRVWIELRQVRQAVELDISDDGVGFDPGLARRRAAVGNSFGLLGMQERVELLGGSFTPDSRPGQGTRIYVRLPLGGRGGRAKGKPRKG